MKKKITKFFIVLLCLPTLFFCACGNSPSNLPSINMATYYEATAKTSLYKEDRSGTINLSDLTAPNPNKDTLAPYTQIILPGKLTWLYKMYIDCITFYVYTNEATDSEMIVNVSLTNMADENDRANVSTFKSEPVSFKPEKDGSVFCKINVNKVIANATDPDSDSLMIDILNSVNGTVADSVGNLTSFRWTIYGLTIYGESRSYSFWWNFKIKKT